MPTRFGVIIITEQTLYLKSQIIEGLSQDGGGFLSTKSWVDTIFVQKGKTYYIVILL